mgnify:CR=1 FL=1
MPTIRDEKGDVVVEIDYDNPNAQKITSDIMQSNPGYSVVDAMERSKKMYAGGGKTGYNVPMYKKGGKVK